MTLEAMIAAHGGQLERKKKHKCYRFPDGRTFVTPASPSDSRRGEKNGIRDLKHFLGLTKHEAVVGERRERKTKREGSRQRIHFEPVWLRPTLREQLRALFGDRRRG